jgi:hypothetical protein
VSGTSHRAAARRTSHDVALWRAIGIGMTFAASAFAMMLSAFAS